MTEYIFLICRKILSEKWNHFQGGCGMPLLMDEVSLRVGEARAALERDFTATSRREGVCSGPDDRGVKSCLFCRP